MHSPRETVLCGNVRIVNDRPIGKFVSLALRRADVLAEGGGTLCVFVLMKYAGELLPESSPVENVTNFNPFK